MPSVLVPGQTRILAGGWLYVPVELFGRNVERVKAELIYRPIVTMGDSKPIVMYTTRLKGYLGVPKAWGLERFGSRQITDLTVMGRDFVAPKRPDPFHPAVLDPQAQANFMHDMLAAVRQYRSIVAMAPTGSGKTTVALNTAAELGRSTLILVHLERLLDQWIQEIKAKLGLPETEIGIIQSDRCDYDKPICVGMLHSLAQRTYPREAYRSFGLVIVDEVHKIGTAAFSQVVTQFPSFYRIGLSATPHRRDGGHRVIFAHLGPIRVKSRATALPGKVFVIRYNGKKAFHINKTNFAKIITQDDERNLLIARWVKYLHDKGRQILVVSSIVGHLQRLIELSKRLGVPETAIGQYTGMREVVGPDGKLRKEKVKPEELERVKREAKIIFATYGMITEGIDIPRLDAGIDAFPRSTATQVIGRIRRPLPGKKAPVWLTVVDGLSGMCNAMFASRRKDYIHSGMEVLDVKDIESHLP